MLSSFSSSGASTTVLSAAAPVVGTTMLLGAAAWSRLAQIPPRREADQGRGAAKRRERRAAAASTTTTASSVGQQAASWLAAWIPSSATVAGWVPARFSPFSSPYSSSSSTTGKRGGRQQRAAQVRQALRRRRERRRSFVGRLLRAATSARDATQSLALRCLWTVWRMVRVLAYPLVLLALGARIALLTALGVPRALALRARAYWIEHYVPEMDVPPPPATTSSTDSGVRLQKHQGAAVLAAAHPLAVRSRTLRHQQCSAFAAPSVNGDDDDDDDDGASPSRASASASASAAAASASAGAALVTTTTTTPADTPVARALAGLEGLTRAQDLAVAFVASESALAKLAERSRNLSRAAEMGFSKKEYDDALLWLRDRCPLISHVQSHVLKFLLNDDRMRNQFDTNSSCGSLSHSMRRQWEARMFGGAYCTFGECCAGSIAPKSVPALRNSGRPVYGVLGFANSLDGCPPASQYGDCHVVFKDTVRYRTTLAHTDSGSDHAILGTVEHFEHILSTFVDTEFRTFLDVGSGRKKEAPGSDISSYKEIQIHGEVLLARDIQTLVIPASANSDTRKTAQQLADKFGITLIDRSNKKKKK